MIKKTPVKIIKGVRGGMETFEYKHDSFVQLSLSRVSGNRRLFGSQIGHQHYFELRVSPCAAEEDNGRIWYFGSNRALMRVALSSSQLLELFTSIGVSQGSCGTLLSLNGELIPEAETPEANHSVAAMKGFAGSVQRVLQDLDSSIEEVDALLESKKPLKQSEKNQLKNLLGYIRKGIERNAEYFGEQFIEASEKVVQSAKAEVESFVKSTLIAHGVKSLNEKDSIVTLPEWSKE